MEQPVVGDAACVFCRDGPGSPDRINLKILSARKPEYFGDSYCVERQQWLINKYDLMPR